MLQSSPSNFRGCLTLYAAHIDNSKEMDTRKLESYPHIMTDLFSYLWKVMSCNWINLLWCRVMISIFAIDTHASLVELGTKMNQWIHSHFSSSVLRFTPLFFDSSRLAARSLKSRRPLLYLTLTRVHKIYMLK